jgi:hypothetical protein
MIKTTNFLIICLTLITLVNSADIRYSTHNGYFPSNANAWFLVCPIMNTYTTDWSVLFSSGTHRHVVISTCFTTPPDRYTEFVNKPLIAMGAIYPRNAQVYAKTVNYDGQPVMLLNQMQDQLSVAYTDLLQMGVLFHSVNDYWRRPMCSDFVHRAYLHITTRNEPGISQLQSEINTCTSRMIWAEIQRREDQVQTKQEILRKSLDLAAKILETIPATQIIGVGADISLKLVDVMREMSVGEQSPSKMVKSLCLSHQIAIDMILRHRQSSHQ